MLKALWAPQTQAETKTDTGSQIQPVGLHLQFVKSLLQLQRKSRRQQGKLMFGLLKMMVVKMLVALFLTLMIR